MSRALEELSRALQGRYRVKRRLGRGGMGEVWLAHDEKLKCLVAIKVLSQALSRDPGFRARFEEEIHTQAKLRHPRIARCMTAGDLPGDQLFLVMEYVPGRTLRAVVDEHRQAGTVMDPLLAVFDGCQLMTGLALAHRFPIVHGDVKLENIMIDEEDEAEDKERSLVVLDFGLAKILGASGGAATAAAGARDGGEGDRSALLGTPGYLAPERILQGVCDARADIFAAGVVMAWTLTGEPPYDHGDGSDTAILNAHVEQEPAPRWERMLGFEYKNDVQAIVMKLLARDPRARYQTAREARDALGAVVRRSVPPGSRLSIQIAAEVREWKMRERLQERVRERRSPDRALRPVPAPASARPLDVTRPLGSPVAAALRTPMLPPPPPGEDEVPAPAAARRHGPAGPLDFTKADVTRPIVAGESPPAMPAPFPPPAPCPPLGQRGWHEWVEAPAADVTKPMAAGAAASPVWTPSPSRPAVRTLALPSPAPARKPGRARVAAMLAGLALLMGLVSGMAGWTLRGCAAEASPGRTR